MKKSILLSTLVVFFFSSIAAIAAQDKVIELKFASSMPPFAQQAQVWKKWAAEIKEKSNGRVNITFYLGGSLVNDDGLYRAVTRGQVDFVFMMLGTAPQMNPLSLVFMLPVMDWPNERVATRIRAEITEKFPEVKAEYKGVKIMWQWVADPNIIHTAKKPVRVPEDLKGLKIASPGSPLNVLGALGAVPVYLAPPEIYMALDRGLVEGNLMGYVPIIAMRTFELLPYHNNTTINYMGTSVRMNIKSWNKLPQDIKKIFEETNAKYAEIDLSDMIKSYSKSIDFLKGKKQTIIENTPEEKAQWAAKVKPIHEEWIEKNEAKGLPARAVYNEVKKLIEEYRE